MENNFLFRTRTSKKGTDLIYKEDFYLNQNMVFASRRSIITCYAYGDCHWYLPYSTVREPTPYFAFEYIVEGEMHFICNRIPYKAKKGDVVLLKKDRFTHISTNGPVHKKALLLAGPVLKFLTDTGHLSSTYHVETDDSGRISSILQKLKDVILNCDDTKFVQEELSQHAYAFILELDRLVTRRHYPEALQRALDIIAVNLTTEMSLASLSENVAVSISTLSRLFRDHLQLSPGNYIINQRLARARFLLQTSSMNVKEVADACSYSSASFFSRAFKQKYGEAPDHFRKRTAPGRD